MSVHISKGNTKLGKHIANISLPPGATCPKGVPCNTPDCCYASKAWRMYPSVRRAWGENLAELVMNPDGYFEAITAYLWTHAPRHFRWHVAGDIPNQAYLDNLKLIAKLHRTVSFLCFTKRYEYDYGGLPDNLSIIISSWPGLSVVYVPGKNGFLPTAWCQDGSETRIPRDAYECVGSCDTCKYCWSATRDVWFHKH
jgi:hypothetical protein